MNTEWTYSVGRSGYGTWVLETPVCALVVEELSLSPSGNRYRMLNGPSGGRTVWVASGNLASFETADAAKAGAIALLRARCERTLEVMNKV